MVGHAARFTATVHGEDGIAHVDTAERDRRGEDVAKRTATSHVAMVDKPLTWHTCLAANLREDGSRHGIARVFLCGVELDDRTTTQYRMIGGVVTSP